MRIQTERAHGGTIQADRYRITVADRALALNEASGTLSAGALLGGDRFTGPNPVYAPWNAGFGLTLWHSSFDISGGQIWGGQAFDPSNPGDAAPRFALYAGGASEIDLSGGILGGRSTCAAPRC